MNVDLLESFFSLGGSGYRIVLFFPRQVHFGPDRLKKILKLEKDRNYYLLRLNKGLFLDVLSH